MKANKSMKLKWRVMFWALCGAVLWQGCSDDDDPMTVSEAIQDAFESKYPSVSNEKWEIKSGYYVAEFSVNGQETEAWFSSAAEWKMTETDLRTNLSLLPEAVQTAFAASEYRTWTVDDIDRYELPNQVTFYLIEVEKAGQKDRKLFYSPDGTLLRSVDDAANDDVLPTISF